MERAIAHSPAVGVTAVLLGTSLEGKQVSTPARISVAKQKRYGRYEVLRLIGEGAMGKVYLARDPVLNRQVAIKVISVDKTLDDRTRLEYTARFSLEAKLSAQLNHQSIVPVYDAGEEAGVPWIAFQFIDGVTLDKILKKHGKLSIRWAVHIAFDIASALQQAHHIHVVHRDIKPANIIVERSGGIAKLTDFGVAKTPWAALTCEGNAMGSPGYMSPEQIEGGAIDERSDLFSLGVVLYEMIAGVHPFVRDSVAATAYAIIGGAFKPAGEVVKGVPSRLDALISQCLSTDPDKRFPTAGHLTEHLRSIMSGNSMRAQPSSPMTGLLAGSWLRLRRTIAIVRRAYTAIRGNKNPAARTPCFGKTWTSARKTISFHAGTRVSPETDRSAAGFLNIPALSRALRRSRRSLAMIALGGAALSGLFIVNLMLSAVNGSGGKLFLPAAGLDKNEKALVSGFPSLVGSDNPGQARADAKLVAETRRGTALGQFMLGVVACRSGDYPAALLAFEAARRQPGGKRLIKRNRRYMVSSNTPRFEQGRAPDGLVMLLAKQFDAAEDPWVKRAVYDTSYWPRWNALRIMQAAGKQIDIARVFILDLNYADNVRTRIQAARDLGEIGDRRAVSALKKAGAKTKNDEFVAAAAVQALKDMQKK